MKNEKFVISLTRLSFRNPSKGFSKHNTHTEKWERLRSRLVRVCSIYRHNLQDSAIASRLRSCLCIVPNLPTLGVNLAKERQLVDRANTKRRRNNDEKLEYNRQELGDSITSSIVTLTSCGHGGQHCIIIINWRIHRDQVELYFPSKTSSTTAATAAISPAWQPGNSLHWTSTTTSLNSMYCLHASSATSIFHTHATTISLRCIA